MSQLSIRFMACAGLAFVAGCKPQGSGNAGKVERPPVAVTVATARAETLQRRVTVVGSLHADEEVLVSNKIAGRVIEILADVGDWVEPGKELARIDPTDYQQRHDQAKFDLVETLAKLNMPVDADFTKIDIRKLPAPSAVAAETRTAKAEIDSAEADLKSFMADIEGARAELDNGEMKYLEAVRNRKIGAATEDEVADRLTRRAALKAALDGRLAKLESARVKIRTAQAKYEFAQATETIVAADAGAMIAQAERKRKIVEATKTALDETTIFAPKPKRKADGPDLPPGPRKYFVTVRSAAEGDYADEPKPLFHLMFLDPLKLKVFVPERFFGEVKLGQTVELRVSAYDRVFEGTVQRMNVVDPTNRTFEAEITVRNGERLLQPGGFAKSAILTRKDAGVVMVPQESIVSYAGVVKLFVLDGSGNPPASREVQVVVGEGREFPTGPGGIPERWVEVHPAPGETGTVKSGDQVITSGMSKLARGTKVEVKPAGK